MIGRIYSSNRPASCLAAFNVGDDMIDSFSFGTMVIDGRSFHSDLIIYPDGRVQDKWWRSQGHVMTHADVQRLLDADPELIIAGTGIHGLMKPDPSLSRYLIEQGIEFRAGPNDRAVAWYNASYKGHRVAGCFHLTC